MPKDKQSEKAARIYLDLRGFVVLEQNWSLSRNKVDIIAIKHPDIYFIKLSTLKPFPDHSESQNSSALRRAAEAWMVENKNARPYKLAEIVIDPKTKQVVSFNY
ncbi:MAG TPA: YraN family protein [Candidatus Sulfotelmatobacter sp.]|nr:YraN family protein [Candidatus Sulfotelmatobacter sp.]